MTTNPALPEGAELQQLISRYLNWHQANPDLFSDPQFRERRHSGEIEALRYVGVPEWLIRIMPAIQWVISRVRRLFRMAMGSS